MWVYVFLHDCVVHTGMPVGAAGRVDDAYVRARRAGGRGFDEAGNVVVGGGGGILPCPLTQASHLAGSRRHYVSKGQCPWSPFLFWLWWM